MFEQAAGTGPGAVDAGRGGTVAVVVAVVGGGAGAEVTGLGVVGLEVAGLDVDGAAEVVGVGGADDGAADDVDGAGDPVDGCAGANNASTK